MAYTSKSHYQSMKVFPLKVSMVTAVSHVEIRISGVFILLLDLWYCSYVSQNVHDDLSNNHKWSIQSQIIINNHDFSNPGNMPLINSVIKWNS